MTHKCQLWSEDNNKSFFPSEQGGVLPPGSEKNKLSYFALKVAFNN